MIKIIYTLLIAMLLVGCYFLYMYWVLGNDSVAQQNNTNPGDINIKFDYLEGLEAEVFKTVDSRTDGEWNKKLTLSNIENSQKAAEGTWSANDVWGWIAWQNADESWQTLVSLDGFDCEELKMVPEQFVNFFYDRTHVNGELYCYSHS